MSRRSSQSVEKAPNPWLVALGSIFIVVFFSFPYMLMLISSLKTQADVRRIPPDYVPSKPQFSNYLDVWSSSVAPGQSLLATTVISVGATLLVLLVATPAAYYVARFRFRGRLAFLFLVLITQMLQPTVLAVGIFQEFSNWTGYAVWGALILVNGAFNLSFAIWIMQAFFASVPKEVDEAALVDGLGRVQTLLKISLPLVWPGIVTAIVFVFVNTWNEYAAAFVLVQQPELQPLTVSMPRFLGLYIKDWQYLFTTAMVAIVPVIILFALIEKRLIGGLTAGSVK
ncbi:carbohydrate ABC transporter permease [Tessaracoccus sp. OH4464_COT-324]|uniref:carbohydrate ABC transporter permease n=1 Tax=Tessaracoccus sp. OH4464_COT-324 TaxID=2491059 RepID=UPI000F63ACF7|nr:carbohydrate ABC transporter permease [Tessaracoccus sp. OH4464_COT-324]RRD46832.1 carbohydrate ABC transporter permease [Tessaracoccus sp. OH4464_COT-324]